MSSQATRDASLDESTYADKNVTATSSDWATVVKSKRCERLSRIPKAWILPSDVINKYAARPISAFEDPINPNISPGVLSARELELTDPKHDATALCQQLQAGFVSSEELVTAFCKRAAVAHQLTNCLTEIMFDEAIQTSRQLDKKWKAADGKDCKPLHGLPVTFKDSFHIKGQDSSIGITALAHKPAKADSQSVRILQDAGAVIISKTNVPQTMLCADTDSIVFGRTCNAHRGDFAAAGSTGGEGTLLAMGGTALGIGGDGAGSVRMPAFVNGVFGYRPSGYRFPLDGVPVFGRGCVGIGALGPVSVTGPLCRSVRDARMITKLVSDAQPWETNPMLLPNPWLGLEAPQRPMRIGVWRDFDHVHLMPPVQRGFELAQQRLETAGHTLIPFKGPSIARVWHLQKMWTEAVDLRHLRSLLSMEPITTIVEKTEIINPPEPHPELSMDHLHSLNIETTKLVTGMAREWNKDSQTLDALLWVPAPHPAVPFDEYTDLTLTGLFNVIDWPAVVLPLNEFVNVEDINQAGVAEPHLFGEEDKRVKYLWENNRDRFRGLPLSVQLVGRRGQDEKLLAIAEAVQAIVRS